MKFDVKTIEAEMERLKPWYHKINLGQGIVTPGLDFEGVWSQIRKSRSAIDYRNKAVLDVASWDGMWAFEAEQLGASMVVAAETSYKKIHNFLFCHKVLGSNVIPFYNISSYNLSERLDVCYAPNGGYGGNFDGFDIVQHLGLLYHLSDPIVSLMEARSVLKEGGVLLLETAIVNSDSPVMLFNGERGKERLYDKDFSCWWAPSLKCLHEMLISCLLEPLPESQNVSSGGPIVRVCVACKALPPNDQSNSRPLIDMGRTWKNRGPGRISLGRT